jgi:hypothetical protein
VHVGVAAERVERRRVDRRIAGDAGAGDVERIGRRDVLYET